MEPTSKILSNMPAVPVKTNDQENVGVSSTSPDMTNGKSQENKGSFENTPSNTSSASSIELKKKEREDGLASQGEPSLEAEMKGLSIDGRRDGETPSSNGENSVRVPHLDIPDDNNHAAHVSVGETTTVSEIASLIEEPYNEDDEPLHSTQCNLFVGDLPKHVTETTLYETFGKFGRVLNVDIKRDKFTGNNLGYGFIKMSTHEEAMAAKNQLDGTTLAGREMRIGWAQKNTTLFINELDGSISTDELRDIFGAYGPLVKYESFVCRSSGGRFGYVKYRHRTDAENAKASMHRKQVGTHLIRVGWGDNSIQKNCVHFQFTAHGAHITEEDVHKHFSTCGKVVSVNLPAYTDGQLKGFGFVHFDDSDPGEFAAGKSICTLSESLIGNQVRILCSYGKRHNNRTRRRNSGSFQTRPNGNFSSPNMVSMPPNANVYGYVSPQWAPYPPQVQQQYYVQQGVPNQSSAPRGLETPPNTYVPTYYPSQPSPQLYYQASPSGQQSFNAQQASPQMVPSAYMQGGPPAARVGNSPSMGSIRYVALPPPHLQLDTQRHHGER